MTRTKKALIVVLSIMCVVCLGMFTLSACKKKEVIKLSKIQISQAPDKVLYIDGEEFKPDGMKVTATFTDDSTRELEASEWTFAAPEMHVNEDEFSSVKSVKVSYTYGEGENEVTKTANQSITITNMITEAEITKYPKQEYSIGQKFNPDGMEIHAKLQNGTEKDIAVTTDNAEFSTLSTLFRKDTEVTVTIGGYELKVPLTILPEIYLEAEYGYKNGVEIPFDTGDSGAIRTDASEKAAKEGAQAMFEAQLKADFALEKIKAAEDFDERTLLAPSKLITATSVGGKDVTMQYDLIVAWLADKDNAETIKTYVEGEDYKKAVEDYLASEKFTEDWQHYVAHNGGDGEYYLGQVNQGDIYSFVFDSSKAGNSNIAFRMASSYLYLADSWTPKAMGDLNFNAVFEIYVNGVKMDIDDDKILEGGMTPDGSANQILWVNWDTVEFENVGLVKGRNVIEIKIKNHGITSPAQSSYNFAINLDTLYVEPAKDTEGNYVLDLDMYEGNDVELTYDISKVELKNVEDKAILTITGTVEGAEGYLSDRINVSVSNLRANTTQDGNTFVATIDVTDLDYTDYDITVDGTAIANIETVDGTKFELVPESTGFKTTYELVEDEETKAVTLKVDSTYKVAIEEANLDVKTAAVDLVLEGKHVYVKIVGDFKDPVIGSAYDLTNAEDKAAVEELLSTKIQKLYYLNFQQNGGAWGAPLGANFHTVTVDVENNKFTVLAEVTGWNVAADTTKIKDEEKGMLHFALNSANNGNDGWNDYKPEIDKFEKAQTIGSKTYTLTYDKENCFGLIYVTCVEVIDENTPAYENKDVTLKQEGDKILLVINGTYNNYEKAEIEAELANIVADYAYHTALNAGLDATVTTKLEVGTTITIAASEPVASTPAPETQAEEDAATPAPIIPAKTGTYTITIDVTGATEEGVIFFHLDFDKGTTNFKAPIAEDAVKEIKTDEARYTLFTTTSADTSSGWAQGLVAIRIAAASAPVFTYDSWSVKTVEEKVLVTIDFTVENMEEEDAIAKIASLDFQAGTLRDADNKIVKLVFEPEDLTIAFDADNNAMTVTADVTSLKPDYYWTHLFLKENADSEAKSIDFGAEVNIATGEKATLGRYDFEVKEREFNYGKRYLLTVTDTKASALEIEKSEFKKVTETVEATEGGEATEVEVLTLEIKGNVTNYSWNYSAEKTPTFVLATASSENGWKDVDRAADCKIVWGEDGAFTITWTVKGLNFNQVYYLHFNMDGMKALSGGDLPSTGVEAAKIVAGGTKYVIAPQEDASPSITVSDATAASLEYTSADIKVEDGKLLYIINGLYENYTKEQLEALYINFDLQGNPYMSGHTDWQGDWSFHANFTKSIAINETDESFVVTIDISSLITEVYTYTTHFALETEENNNPNDDNKIPDFKPQWDSFAKTVTFNNFDVKMSLVKGGGDNAFWGCVGITVSAHED